MSTQPREFDKVDRALELQVIDWLQWGEFPDRLDRPSMPALALELIAKRKLAFASLETENLRLSDELNFFKSCATAQALKIASREEELEQAKAYIHEYRIKRGDTVESMVLEIRSLKEIAESYRDTLKEIVKNYWFDRTKEPGIACWACDCGEAGQKTNSDGHDHSCPVSIARAVLDGEKK